MNNPSEISAEIPDWSREAKGPKEWSPQKDLLHAIRQYQRWKGSRAPWAVLFRAWYVFRHRRLTWMSGAEIQLNSQIGGGLILPHPNGVVVHPQAVIGPNCLLFQQVTIGVGPVPGYPVLEGHVDVGAGAKILGGVRIGAHARIGANAVVIRDVESRSTVGGVPARPIRSSRDQ